MKQIPVKKKITSDLLNTMRNMQINEYFSIPIKYTQKARNYAYSIKTMEGMTYSVNKNETETKVIRLS